MKLLPPLRPRSFATVLAALALATPVVAQAAAPAETLPEARAVVDRYAEATGLAASLPATKSMHVKGRFSMAAMQLEGAFELWSAPPNLQRNVIEMGPFGTATSGHDGTVGWMTHPLTGARILKGTELLQSRLDADWDGALKPAEDFESLRTLGRETFEGTEAWKVEVVAKPLPGMDPTATREARTSVEYYAVDGGLLIGKTGRVESDLGSSPITYVFSDYRDFGGRKMPAKTIIRQASQEFVITVEAVAYDTVAPDVFRVPAEIQTMLGAEAAEGGASKPQ